MKVIISPSKEKLVKPFFYNTKTPLFNKKVDKLVNQLKQLNIEEIKKAYKCSEKIAEKVKYNFANFNKEKYPAISFYNGIQYKYLDIESLDRFEISFLIENIYILDALYGFLRANDLISEYRLDYQTKLPFFDNNYYKKEVNSLINENVINLCSKEYSNIIDKDKLFNIFFIQNKKGIRKSFSTDTKIARGMFINYIAKIKSTDISKLKKFNLDGYILTKESEKSLTFEK